MSCCGRCGCQFGSPCVSGTGRASDPWDLVFDPAGTSSCGPDGIYTPPGSVGFGGAASVVYVPGSPPPAAAQIASAAVTVTNPTTKDAVGKFTFTIQANKNLHGSVSTDVILSAQFDGAGFTNIVQDLHALTGAHALDPALGGDGTVSVFGRNGMHLDMSDSQSRVSGDITGVIPALITPGPHTLDLSLDMLFTGLWDDPANPGDNFAFWAGFVAWELVPA